MEYGRERASDWREIYRQANRLPILPRLSAPPLPRPAKGSTAGALRAVFSSSFLLPFS